MDTIPSLGPLFIKAVLTRRQAETLPDTRLSVADQPVDADRLWRYQQLCGFRVGPELPPTYLHLMTFPLSIALMAGSSFPLPLLGLVHVENRIQQGRPVQVEERVDVSAWAENLREHPAGRQVDLVSEARIEGEVVWHEVSTYLHREHATAKKAPSEQGETAMRPVIRWRAPSGVGRAYAAISGDRNPIHLSDLSAKVFGFKAAIAHGMWLKARTLAAFEGRLPAAGTFAVAFKTPIFLPATVELQSDQPQPGRSWNLTVHDVRTGRPHLTGTISH